jgi:hypothetical protein
MSQLHLVHTVPLIYLYLVSVLYYHLGLGDFIIIVFNKVLRRVYCVVIHCYCRLWYYVLKMQMVCFTETLSSYRNFVSNWWNTR